MTSISTPLSARRDRPDDGGPLPGFANLFRKEIGEWRRGRRAIAVTVASTAAVTLFTANAAIIEWIASVVPADAMPDAAGRLSMDPRHNLLQGVATQVYLFAGIFATISLLIVERDKGTLAWTLSKPVSRTSVLAAKWVSASAMLWLLAVVVPIGSAAALAGLLYGDLPDPVFVATLAVTLAMTMALVASLTLAAGTVVRSQAAVAAIALGTWFMLPLVAGIVPEALPLLPVKIDTWGIGLALGEPVGLVTPVAWLLALVGLLWFARRRLVAMEF